MESKWIWDRLEPLEQRTAELLVAGKSNAAICNEVYLSRARVQECIKRIQIKTGTDSTRAAIALLVEERENQTLLRVLERSTDGVAILQDRVFRFVNKPLAEMHGYDDPEEMVGVPFVELIAPTARGIVAERYDLRMLDSPVPRSYVTTIRCKDGQEKKVTIASAGLIRYRGKPAVLAVAHSLETQERETQTLLSILDQASDGLVIIQDGLRKFANTALGKTLGYTPEDTMAGAPFVEFIAPSSRGRLVKNYELRMRGEPFPGQYVVTALCKGGQEKDLTITSAGLIQYRGKPALLAIVVPAE